MSTTYLSAVAERAAAMETSSTADALRAALEAGSLSPADYFKEARACGVDTTTIASILKAAVVARDAQRDSRPELSGAARASGVFDANDFTPGSLDASLAWLRARPHKWGERAAERLTPDNDFLVDLDLYDTCEIDDEGARHLATGLKVNATVTSVNLSQNYIGDAGVDALCRALEAARMVTHLDLSENKVGAAGADALIRLLGSEGCPLQTLRLSSNAGIGEQQQAALRSAWGDARKALVL